MTVIIIMEIDGLEFLLFLDKGKTSKRSKSQFHYRLNNREYSFNTPENSLLIFRGDKVQHKVSSLANDELRIVISFLFCDICERRLNPVSHIYQSGVNAIFNGKI